jgi:ABC-type amino acid transport substrate-binding protein
MNKARRIVHDDLAGFSLGRTDKTMAVAKTFAQRMLEKYETLLEQNAGVERINIDGQDVTYADLEKKYEFWRARVLKEGGKAPTISTIRLDRKPT